MGETICWEERIQQGIRRSEETMEEKRRLAQECAVEFDELFTPEEVAPLIESNENFHGTQGSWEKMERYHRLAKAAEWINAHCVFVTRYHVQDTKSDHPNAIVTVDLRHIAQLSGEPLKVFSLMASLSDSVTFSDLVEETIRITFAVQGIWKEK